MNEQKNNGRGIFYGVIGVATLVVAIVGATFAYFTATQTAGNNVIGGNMATISFGVKVEKIVDPGQTSGMIPMSNTMIEAAVKSNNEVCVDDNGNAVCQIYKITVTNTSSAAMFVDGYVALAGGSGTPTDYPESYMKDGAPNVYSETNTTGPVLNTTSMRWAQVFVDGDDYSTGGTQKLGYGTGETVTLTQIGKDKEADPTGKNSANILTSSTDVRGTLAISGSTYTTIDTNYIRLSNHAATTVGTGVVPTTSFDRTDVTSTLELSQQLQPVGDASGNNVAVYYFMVWLAETGKSQNPNTTGTEGLDPNLATSANNFFNGVVTFNSAQGSEVTATFSGYTAVQSDKAEQ